MVEIRHATGVFAAALLAGCFSPKAFPEDGAPTSGSSEDTSSAAGNESQSTTDEDPVSTSNGPTGSVTGSTDESGTAETSGSTGDPNPGTTTGEIEDTCSSEIAFVRDGSVWVYDRASGVDSEVSGAGGFDDEVVWTPDGASLFFRRGRRSVFRSDLDGTTTEVWNNGGEDVLGLQVSEDGARLGFLSVDPNGSNVAEFVTMNVDGSGASEVVPETAAIYPAGQFRYAPDFEDVVWPSGRNLVYASLPAGGTTTLFQANCPGDCPVVRHISYSPTGADVVFSLLEGGISDIYRVGTNGNGAVNLTSSSGVFATRPSWGPGGGRVAFEGSDDIYVMEADGSELQNVSNSGASESYVVWSPDSQAISYLTELVDDSQELTIALMESGETEATGVSVTIPHYQNIWTRVMPPLAWRPCR